MKDRRDLAGPRDSTYNGDVILYDDDDDGWRKLRGWDWMEVGTRPRLRGHPTAAIQMHIYIKFIYIGTRYNFILTIGNCVILHHFVQTLLFPPSPCIDICVCMYCFPRRPFVTQSQWHEPSAYIYNIYLYHY